MSNNYGGVFNRLNTDLLINWEQIEEIEIVLSSRINKGKAVIFYKSGRIREITKKDHVESIIDLLEVFPNIVNPVIRNKIKLKSGSNHKKTDINVNDSSSKPFKTDIEE